MRVHPVVPAIVLALAIVRLIAGGVSWLTFVSVPLAMLWLVVEIRSWSARRESEESGAQPPDPSPTPPSPQLRAAAATILRMREDRARPPPPLPDEAEIRATAQPAIFVRRTDLPVPLDHPSRSYLGGLPRLPPEMAWPEVEKYDRFALNFLAQIDLAELPPIASSPLPRSGTLFFFADLTDEAPEPSDCRVLYYAGDTARVPIRDLPPEIRPYGPMPSSWFAEDSLWARTGFRFPLGFSLIDSYRDYFIEQGARHPPRHNRDVFKQVTSAEYTRRFGAHAAPPRDQWRELSSDRDEWPFAWVAIEYGARALAHAVRIATERKPSEIAQEFQAIAAAASRWIERAARETPHAECDARTRAEFLEEWRALLVEYEAAAGRHDLYPRYLASDLDRVVIAACHTCASHGATEVVPPVYRDALRHLNDASVNFPMHQMLGHGECVQWAPIDYGEQILLLQLIGDPALGWHSNSGCALQFWVDPAAAARKDFDKVAMTLECD